MVLKKLGIGGDIYFYESYRKNGRMVYKDKNGKEVKAPNGWYAEEDGSIHIDLNSGGRGQGYVLYTLSHELTHFIQDWSPKKFKILADFLIENYEKGRSMDEVVMAKQDKLSKIRGEKVSYDEAYFEVIADSMEAMLADGNVVQKIAELRAVDNSIVGKMKQFFDNLLTKIRNIYKGLKPDSEEGKAVLEMTESIEKLQQIFAEALVEASDTFQAAEIDKLTPGEEGTVYTKNGDPVAHSTNDGTIQLSIRTYDEAGRKALRSYLEKCVKNQSLTKTEMQEMLDGIEEIYEVCKDFKDKYAPFSAWSDAEVIRDTRGKPVFSVVTPNGDYKMNLDFSLVCKKRRTLDAVFNEMSRRGIIDNFELGQKSVVKINEIIRKYGLETACALCFVDAKRFRQASMADQFTRLYNELVTSLVPEDQKSSIGYFNFSGYSTIKKVDGGIDTWKNSDLDFSHINYVLKKYGDGTVEYKAAKYIKTHPEGRKLLLRGDFMSSQGFDAVKIQNQDILKLYNSKKGTGGPKAAFGDVQYMNEIIQKARWWTPAKAYSVGGVRIQSFSDYVPRMVFDYTQMIYDLAATKLPAHAYTKEALFVKQFGLTGAKINMSLIPAIAEDGIAPGLDANGNYVWAGESFDFETAKQIQNAEGYTENCGTICVGVSHDHIVKLLNDPDIRMVIPYHKSGLNPIVAHMNKIAAFEDYTNDQRTKGKDGKALENDFDFDKALHDMGKNGNPKAVADQYLKWCVTNGYTAKFSEFAAEENYYKLLEDFTLYDKDGNYVPQRAVKAVFPTDASSFGSMKDLIQEGLQEDAIGEGKRDSNLSAIVDEIQRTLPKTEAEIEEVQVEQADRDLEANKGGIMLSDRELTEDPLYPSTAREKSAFNREYINKTNGLKPGKEKHIIVNTHRYIYHVKASGRSYKTSPYLGEIIEKVPVDSSIAAEELLEEIINGTYRATEEDYLPYEEAPYVRRRNDGGAPSLRERLAAEGYDYLLDEPYEGESDENRRQGGRNRENGEVKLSDRDTESVSNRTLLSEALDSAVKNDIERRNLEEYKANVEKLDAEEAKLRELRAEIRELSFAKGKRDTARIKELRDEATKTANRIGVYDKRLLRMEAAKPLQDVLAREMDKVRARERKHNKEVVQKYRTNAEATAIRSKIQRVVKELNKLLLHESKDRHVPDNLKKSVADALALVNMDTTNAEARVKKYADLLAKETDPDKIDAYTVAMENAIRQGEKMGQKLSELRAAYEEISNDPYYANAYDDGIAGNLRELAQTIGDTSIKNMTVEQLSDVYDMYKAVLTRIRDVNKAFKAARHQTIEALGTQVINEVSQYDRETKYSLPTIDAIAKFGWNNLKPVYAFEMIGSDTFREIFQNVRAGEDVWAKDVSEAREYYLSKAKQYDMKSWDTEKRYSFESTTGKTFELNLEQIMSLYAFSKRKQAADHLRKGGIVIDESTEVTLKKVLGIPVKFNPTKATAYNLSDDILADIISKLTPQQKRYVDDMQDYLSTTMGEKGNEVSLELYGIRLFKDKFYFPLKSATQFMAKAKEQQQGETKIKNSGFTKETVQHASNPIVLTPFMSVWANHVNEMSLYHAFTLPMEDFYRVYSYKTATDEKVDTVSVEMAIQNAFGKGATSYIDQLMKDLNGGARSDPTAGVISKLTGMFKKSAVFASASVVVQQPSAIARAAAVIDTKYFIGPKIDGKRHDMLWAEVKKYAPVAIIKEMGYFDTNVGKSTQDYIMGKEYDTLKEKASAFFTDSNFRDEQFSKAPALADELAWCSIWEAVKRETNAKYPGMDVKSEAFLKRAGSRFTEVIVKTQVYDSVLSRSANMRSKDNAMKMATAFMAEPTTSINMVADALLKGKRGGKEGRRYCRNAIGAVVASQILNSFLVAWVYAARDDDDDESYAEKWLSQFVGSLVDGMNPLTYIPILKDFVSIFKGYDVERSDMAVISDLWDAFMQLKNESVSPWRKIENLAASSAQIFGLPLKNIMRDTRAIYQVFDTVLNGEDTTAMGIGYAFHEGRTGETVSNANQLYEARIRENAPHAQRVEARYEDADAADAAVRSAIRTSFMDGDIGSATAREHLVAYGGLDVDEAYWYVDSWEYAKEYGGTDGYEKFAPFYEAVQTGNDLRNVIQRYLDNGVTEQTLRSQITEYFKPDYIKMTATERSNLKGYLINALELCGKTRDEAAEILDDWDFEAVNGFDYGERREAYINGEITASQLRNALITYGNYEPETADAQIEAYNWQMEGYETATGAAVTAYNEFCAALNVPRATFLYIRQVHSNTENDIDPVTGESIDFTAMQRIMAVIDAQPGLSPAQKTAIARSLGWPERNIRKYKPW